MSRIKEYAYYAALWLIALIFFAPIAWIVMSSFKTRSDILAVPPKLVFSPTLENYEALFSRSEIFQQIGNSILLSLGA
ncbi:MAG: sugar ABC transporter permease, partial [Fulvimarina sp.]|nr:sugar ABC transporter permease [Fulvimarina sp.]